MFSIHLAESAILWSTIERIEALPAGEPVYDLCLDRHHCFIANNLVVHNAGPAVSYRGSSPSTFSSFLTLNKPGTERARM